MSASAGRLGFALVGTVIGAYFGFPQIGLAIGTLLGSIVFPPEGKVIEGPRLDDLKVTFSSYGNPIPRIYGKMEVGGNIAWSPGLVEHRIEEDESGKGGPSLTTVTFLYTASFRIIYGAAFPNPAQAILRNWADGKLVRDRTGTGPVQTFLDSESPGNQAIRDFLGESTQLPGPAEQADKGIADTPAYRFQVSQEWEDMPLGDFGNRIPQMSAEVAMFASETLPTKIISPPTGLLTEGFQTSLDSSEGYILEGGGNRANRINLISQDVIETITYASSDNVYALDDFGRIWSSTGFGGDLPFRVSEASTGKLIASIDSNAEIGGLVSQFILLDGGLRGAIAVGANDKLLQLSGVVGTVVNNVRDGGDSPSYKFGTWFPGSFPILGANGITLDGAGDVWVSYSISGDGVLFRINGITGDPAEKITFSSRPLDFITYDEGTNSLIIQEGGTGFFRFSLDSKTVTSTIVHALSTGDRNKAAWKVINGKFMYLQETLTGVIGVYDVSGDEIVRLEGLNPRDWTGGTNNWEAPFYDPVGHALVVTRTSGTPDGDYAWLFLDRAASTDITVRSIVEDVSLLVDYVAGTDIDATELTDTFPGYMIRTRMTARKALEPLATAFNWRSVESDFMIKFPKRGGASIGNIPQIDLGATAGEVPTTQPLKKTRMTEDQLFETALIEYIDPTFDNNPNTQQAKRIREAIDVGGSLIFNFPGALGNDQAKQIIERILFQAWAGRTGIETSIPLKHILKDPGDVVTITKDGKTIQVELHNVRLGANSVIKIEGTIDDSVVHESTATGVDALGDEEQIIVISGTTDLFILDTPLLRDLDDGHGIYVGAGTPEGASWPGAQIFRGTSATAFSPFVGMVSSRNLDYGVASTILADAGAGIWDRTNSLTLNLTSGALSSDTEDNVLNGSNALLVGDEIIQFTTAVLNADGTYTISILLRGRRGTEFATGTHVAKETVIVLSSATLLRVDVNLSEHLSTFFYKAITLGSSQFSSITIEQVLNLRSQMPYAPSHIAGSISADDWTFTLKRRTRVGGSWRNLTGTPLGEASEAYEWDVMDGATVKRTLTSSTESVTYTSAQQVTDFGDNQTTVELNVHQMSAEVGRGFVTNVTLVGG